MRERTRLTTDTPYTVALAELDPIRLRGTFPLHLTVGQIARIVAAEDPDDPLGPFDVHTVQYLYEVSTPEDREILSFHWRPDASGDDVVTTPHLHIGPAITAGQSVLRPRDPHKAHVPTGVIGIVAVVRLAILEFGVRPLPSNWANILQRAEDAANGGSL